MVAFVPEPIDSAERLLGDAARAQAAGRERVRLALIDLFLPDGRRLRDIERAAAANLLQRLVATVEDDLRDRIGQRIETRDAVLATALTAGATPIAAPMIEHAGMLRDAELVGLVLRRAEEHRLSIALRLAAARVAEFAPEPPLIDMLVDDAEPAIAEAAMAMIVAESRRIDRFQDPVLARTDLPAEVQHRLIWRVAACLRRYMIEIGRLDPATADREVGAAAQALLAGYDESATLEGRAIALALLLRADGRLSDALIGRALGEGRVALTVAALALRAGIEFGVAWDMLFDADGSRLAVLLSAIGMDTATAADILFRCVPSDMDPETAAGRVEAFMALDRGRAEETLRPWRLDPAFRNAIDDLNTGLRG
ncbi:Uncharacterized conserved protein, DUF2336 family [Sphingomonas laterariae]|uniref:Uncharacterized conserved protein, DUF2336 family n=1 Tax=Edaphosphingomonas laterariae TaxID=861865 RepID=A0A239BPZ2_9SPHN|nr:DUF2336 domain-containing protein [Sphingomonas laterariae]SNS09143.1 Uncharacterized conserved protein, DUF2336 family [Sphingomonas laterariae]